MSLPDPSHLPVTQSPWYRSLAKYAEPNRNKAIFQLLNTFVPYIALWILMVRMLAAGVSYGWIAPLIVVSAGLLVRVFIFFHDCCHGSFFESREANRIWGYICGILIFTPFENWRHHHAEHHATSADLDRRGVGDVWTMTVEEYLAAPLKTRIAYRIFRNPLVLFVLAPPIVFLIGQRLPHKGISKRERQSVAVTNLALLALLALIIGTLGWRAYLLIQLPAMCLASAIGVWLFYVQHQFEKDYWARHEDWSPIRAALEGSSYYKLPKILQWFSGNIGLHHIHHLRPRIPNYNLQRCYDETPALQEIEPLTLPGSLKSLRMNLWDEQTQRMVSFRSLKALVKRPATVSAS